MAEIAADPLAVLVVAIGAAITIGSLMVTGLKLERLLTACYAPLPPDVGAIGGFMVGVFVVARWLT